MKEVFATSGAYPIGSRHVVGAKQKIATSAFGPREQMAEVLPGWIQPFLTWLTAKPAPGEQWVPVSALTHVFSAFAVTLLTGLGQFPRRKAVLPV